MDDDKTQEELKIKRNGMLKKIHRDLNDLLDDSLMDLDDANKKANLLKTSAGVLKELNNYEIKTDKHEEKIDTKLTTISKQLASLDPKVLEGFDNSSM